MSDLIGFLEVIGAILASLGLAMSLEWLTLNGLLHLMPSRTNAKFHRRLHPETVASPKDFSPR